MTRSGIWSACLLWMASVARLPAQTTGALVGTVYDPSGVAVAGAAVRIVQTNTHAERSLATDARGRYLAPGLAPGTYQVEASHAGFRSQLRGPVEVGAGRSARLDFLLELGAAHEKIEVVAEMPLVSSASSDWGGSIEQRKLDSLPLNGRDLYDLSAQEPGATVPTTAYKTLDRGLGIHVSVHGARPNQNSFRMDGIYINDATASAPTSASGRLLGLEGIYELRLVTSPFSAEHGRAAGAVFTAVSRSGSNELHASLYEFLRNSALDAKNYFDFPQEKTPPLRKNQFGGLLSGPLRRDRVFFLANYEGLHETSSRTLRPATLSEEARRGRLPGSGGVSTAPVAPQVIPYLDLYPLPNGRDFGDGTGEFITESVTPAREDYLAGKLDAIVSGKLRGSARYTFDNAETHTPDPFRIWRFVSDSRYQFLHSEAQYVPSASAIHSFRAGFSRIRNSETSPLMRDFPASMSFVRGQPLGAIEVVGLSELGGLRARLAPRRFVVNDFQFNHDGTYVRGAHSLRLGAGYDRVQFNQVADINAAGFYRFDSVADLLAGRPRAGDLMAPGSDSIRGWRQNQFFVFAQEEFRASTRLSWTVGLRFEGYSTPAEVNGKIATLRDPLRDATLRVGGPLFENPSRKNFAPRAALAWDPAGSGHTVVRAGAGIFFDLLGVREVAVAGARMPPFFNRLAPRDPSFPDLLGAARQLVPPNTTDGLDFYLLQPYVLQFQWALERQLDASTFAKIGYAGARGVHLPGQLSNVNPTRPQTLPDGRLFFPADAPRINPAFGKIGMRRTQFNSFYHALLASIERKWRGRFRFQAKYAFSKSIDETSNTIVRDFLNSDRMPMIFNYRQNRGLSDFDLRHSLAANFSCQLPGAPGTAGKILGNWELHGLAQAQTGPPFAPFIGFDRARLNPGSEDPGERPDWTGAPGARVILGEPERYFDPFAFSLPPAGMYGNLGRNTLPGPGLVNLDLALHKILWQTDRHSARLRLEFFNLANHPNFQIPSGQDLFNSDLQRVGSAGRITATTTAARQIQMALKWMF
jgi:hypothetical protein